MTNIDRIIDALLRHLDNTDLLALTRISLLDALDDDIERLTDDDCIADADAMTRIRNFLTAS